MQVLGPGLPPTYILNTPSGWVALGKSLSYSEPQVCFCKPPSRVMRITHKHVFKRSFVIQALKIGNPSLRDPCSDYLSPTFQSGRFHIKNFICSFS